MKSFALAATVVAGLLCTASSADAQYRVRGGVAFTYGTPRYYTPASNYSYYTPVYMTPEYNGVVSVGAYTPLGGTRMIVPSNYYTPSSYTPMYNYPVYSGYRGGVYIAPSSGNYYYRGRGGRW